MSFEFSENVEGTKVFLTKFSEVTGNRWDTHYHQPRYRPLITTLQEIGASKIHDSALAILSGITPLSGGDAYTEDASGVAFVRSGDFNEDGSISEQGIIRLKPIIHKTQMQRSQLQKGDVLFAIVGATIGKVGLFSEDYAANINQAVCAVRFGPRILPEFAHAFFLTSLGQGQINRIKRPVARANINLEEVGSLLIPVLPKPQQSQIVDILQSGFQKKRQVEAQARALLASIDAVLLAELGIAPQAEPPNTLENRIFRTKFSEVTGQRFDSSFHHPSYARLTAALEKHSHVRLGEVVKISREQWDQNSLFDTMFPYLEIGEVDLDFGIVGAPAMTPIAEAASRAKMIVRPGDLLVSLTRPTRRAIAFAPEELEPVIASNGFSIIREIDASMVTPRYIFHVLRSRLCTAQFEQRSSGGNYPAITEEQVLKILIPLPEKQTAAEIAAALDQIYEEAQAMLQAADAQLEAAKREIEALILGEMATAPMD